MKRHLLVEVDAEEETCGDNWTLRLARLRTWCDVGARIPPRDCAGSAGAAAERLEVGEVSDDMPWHCHQHREADERAKDAEAKAAKFERYFNESVKAEAMHRKQVYAERDAAEKRALEAEAEAAMTRAALEDLEWCGGEWETTKFGPTHVRQECPQCGRERPTHAESCEVAVALATDAGRRLLAEVVKLRALEAELRDWFAVCKPCEDVVDAMRAVEEARKA